MYGLYSLVDEEYGISVAHVYKLEEGTIKASGGGVSEVGASERVRKNEAKYARGWYAGITMDMFG